MKRNLLLTLAMLMIFTTACGFIADNLPAPAVNVTSQAISTQRIDETVAPSPQASEPLATPVPVTASPATRFSTEPHPLQIEVERGWDYPGSPITFEETLQPKARYDQYVVSYLSDGYKNYAYMAIPNGIKPETGWPTIILNHGYSNRSTYVTTEKYIAFMDVLSRMGYIVFKPDYRAHGNSEGPAPAGGGYGSPDYMVDVLNAVASIKAYPDADPDRIGMVGHSMGGAITLRAMVVSKDIKAGVIWSGVVAPYSTLVYRWSRAFTPTPPPPGEGTPTPNPTEQAVLDFMGRASGWAAPLFSQYGSPLENPAFWDSISPTAYLKDLSGPLQLQASWADPQVPAIWSQELAEQMEAEGVPHEVYLYEGDDHNLTNNFLVAISRTRAFFDEHVKNR